MKLAAGTNPERRARCLGRHLNDAGRGHIPLASGPAHTFPQEVWGGGEIGALESWGASYSLADHPVRSLLESSLNCLLDLA